MAQRKTPLMGWASWNCYRTNISEEIIKAQADALVRTGLADCGYTYVNIDDGFFGGRDAQGCIQAHKTRFPNGMKVVADYIHSLGLKAGIYSDAGDNTCGFYYDREGADGTGVGLYGHEETDLKRYLIDWGYDFIKVDWCGGLRMGLDEETQYSKIGRIIQQIREESGKDIVYNVCRWQFPGEWVTSIADSWRTGSDIAPRFESVMHQLDMVRSLRDYCSPGHVNDLDMLQIGNGMTLDEDTTHFLMWCMMSTPLMIGCEINKLDDARIEMLSNRELIAVHQDAACRQAFVVKESGDASNEENCWEIWVKDLGCVQSSRKAVVLLNRGSHPVTISASLPELGLRAADAEQVSIHNLLTHKDEAVQQTDGTVYLTYTMEPHCCVALTISAPEAIPVEDRVKSLKNVEILPITMAQLSALQNVQLVDVRSREEFAAGHMEGAINIPYTEIHATGKKGGVLDDAKKVVVYCTTGKRCTQAAKSLMYLGYTDVNTMTWRSGK